MFPFTKGWKTLVPPLHTISRSCIHRKRNIEDIIGPVTMYKELYINDVVLNLNKVV